MSINTKYAIQTDLTDFERSMRKVQKMATDATKQAAKGFQNLSSSILGANSGLATLAKGFAGGAAITAFFSAFADGVSTIKDFEKAQSNLAGILGSSGTTEALAALENQALSLGAATQFSASQVVQLQTELAKLGFTAREINDSTAAVLKLSQATGAELGEAASLAGATLRAFNLDAKEMSRVTSILAVSTTKSALDFSKLATSMSIVSPVANAFGFSVEDTVAMLGKLSDAGFDASSAATATRNILLNLANSNGKLAKALGRPIHSAEELSGALVELRNKGVDLNEALAMTDKRSVAAFETFLTSAEGVGELSKQLTRCNEELDVMCKTMTDNLQGSLDSLGSAWEGFMLSLSGSKGVIRSVVDGITELVRGLTSLVQTYKQNGDAELMNAQADAMQKAADASKNYRDELVKLVDTKRAEARAAGQDEEEAAKKAYATRLHDEKALLELAQRQQDKLQEQADYLAQILDGEVEVEDRVMSKHLVDKGFDRVFANSFSTQNRKELYKQKIAEVAKAMQDTANAEMKVGILDQIINGSNTEPVAVKVQPDIENPKVWRERIKALEKERSQYNYDSEKYRNLTIAIQDFQRKIDETEGKKRESKAKSDTGIDYAGYWDSLQSSDLKTIDKTIAEISDEIYDYMMKSGDMAGTEWLMGMKSALESRADELKKAEVKALDVTDAMKVLSTDTSAFDLSQWENYADGIGKVVDSIRDYVGTLEELGMDTSFADGWLNQVISKSDEAREKIAALTEQQKEYNKTQKSIEGMTEIFSSASDAVGQYAEESQGAAAAQKLLAAAESAAALASAIHTAANGGDPYTVAARIIAATAAVVTGLSSLKFASGGVVGGSSYNADRVPAMVQSGEMILNKRQQRNLFALLDGNVSAHGGGTTTINMVTKGKELKAVVGNYDKSLNRLR